MKKICLYFEIHQIVHLKRYRFFDIGRDHYYYDDFENERSINDIAERSYIPTLQTLIQMCKENDNFCLALSLSGVGLEQLEFHAPQVVDLLQELNATGKVEFLCEPYSHGLASLANEESFIAESQKMAKKIEDLFGQIPKVFRNSSLIYNDDIGAIVANMGYKGILTEGAKQVLGWKSPHYVYSCVADPRLKLLMRDINLSEDITVRFQQQHLMADQWLDWIAQSPEEEKVFNIFGELVTFGIFQQFNSGILEFLKALPKLAAERGITFATPSQICDEFPSVGQVEVPYNISWVDEERDTSAWLGNQMQREAFQKLYSVADRVRISNDRRIQQDWDCLQASNNFRFMNTKPGAQFRAIYDGPYDAFTNYMNILGDFITRVNNLYGGADNDEIEPLIAALKNQGDEIIAKDKEIAKLREQLLKYISVESKTVTKKSALTTKKESEKKAEPVKKTKTTKKPATKKVDIEVEPAYKSVVKKTATKKTSK